MAIQLHKQGKNLDVVGQIVLNGTEYFIVDLGHALFLSGQEIIYSKILIPKHNFKVDNGIDWITPINQ